MKPCFPALPHTAESQSPVKQWLETHCAQPIVFSDAQHVALARLLPLLICGEQSSQWVFHNEVQRQRESNPVLEAAQDFESIVADEQYHEEALEWVRNSLSEPADIVQIKRRSQRFFASLGVKQSFDIHFAQIACLDALVCRLMLAIEKGSFDTRHPFVLLCRAIKQDEAKHVTLSKRHAITLGFDSTQWRDFQLNISKRLYELLATERAAFDTIGVNLDDIFNAKDEH
ncbi:hypothetical protein BCU70_16650 [Vibrio sp. 10N.286.49.C2]|uniref:hypothetical protein n=1 Tax=unclassified Vibrio TaxID=2614977 RepID=UPI000C8565DD|nr:MULTISPECIES: hypothetical protein [unclassified Vibrio]PMH37263.1 hypothetical protein BCU70_16650 [Vibrio sp. 10N.286.49.C2]PMH57408.1 hypothetical protein BCU66_05290 [Vibrio sp. 10N.286.49.B1]PMH82167.1 hypothetical protein BCU58_19170 [Vibrio sp. 10N.286.48.B7]